MPTTTVAILLFDEVEVLDFCGPFEVFSVASRVAMRDKRTTEPPFQVVGVARSREPVRARGGLVMLPHQAIGDALPVDVLIVPGGVVDQPLADAATIAWIKTMAGKASLTASVCTGAFLLAKAGLLAGRRATTHWEDAAALRSGFPDVTVVEGVPWVDEGAIVTSGGISAGIDMSLHLVERLLDRRAAEATARQMEYRWNRL